MIVETDMAVILWDRLMAGQQRVIGENSLTTQRELNGEQLFSKLQYVATNGSRWCLWWHLVEWWGKYPDV
jgi:hypothetical protein